MSRVRIDKWLWAARFFKTRSLAARACDLGRITSNGLGAKPARELPRDGDPASQGQAVRCFRWAGSAHEARHVHVGDLLQVRNEAGDFQVEVLILSEMRGPAAVAQTLYRMLASKRREPSLEGRPSKRDRRDIDRFRGRV